MLLIASWLVPVLVFGATPADRLDMFALDGSANIMEEDGFGIVNGKITAGVNYKDVCTVSGLWAPPYVSSDFLLDLAVAEQKVATQQYKWLPFAVVRAGEVQGMRVGTSAVLVADARAVLVGCTLSAQGSQANATPVRVSVAGTLDRISYWEFSRAQSKTAAPAALENGLVVKAQGEQAIALGTDLANAKWDPDRSSWCGNVTLPSRFHVAVAIGPKPEASQACQRILADPNKTIEEARTQFVGRVDDMLSKLPALESENQALAAFYRRSLIHFLMNRWDVPEFVLHPYYSTGSVKGGCVCDYLWDFGETWEILPLYDPQAVREHIKQFLKTDLTTHFAFIPTTGEAFGPWYPVNQEKIIGLIYYYISVTGDAAFLSDMVDGKSILDWAVYHAMYGDDLAKPVALMDYGPSNSHLELRRGFPYNHVMPDLNGRRYANYLRASDLAALAGKPAPVLRERAEALKTLLKQKLWNPEAKWFYFQDDAGRNDLRYTIQMFKLFGGGVLDHDEEAGLLSHLNEREFLSDQGLHSMSKTDVAYDQVDIDNGGGGNCTAFPPQIAERLYRSGHAAEADDILRRILWWGERMPYWGDSIVANSIDYRKDTPLQCTLDGVTVAQCIIFGLFGVQPKLDGTIVVDPHRPPFAPTMALKNLRLRGSVIDIAVEGDTYRLSASGATVQQKLGTPATITATGLQ